MGFILRNDKKPADSFREEVDVAMRNVLEKGGFNNMDEILERGNTDKAYKKTPSEYADDLYDQEKNIYYSDYSNVGIAKMFGESWVVWVKDKNKVHNYVWQRVCLEVFTSICKSRNSSKIMEDFSYQIAYEYGNAVWNTIFDKYQRFFIMLWRMNTFYSRINLKQKELIFSINGFYKSINKAIRKLGREVEKVDLEHSNVCMLENFFEKLLEEIKQDKTALLQMCKISNDFAENFGKTLWYGRFSELQKFVIMYSEVNRVWQILKQ